MTVQPTKSYWRKLTDSWKEAVRLQLTPEYFDHFDRGRNHRYYR